MISIHRSLAVLSLTSGLLLTTVQLPAAARYDWFHRGGWEDIHGLVGRTQEDLRVASEIEHNNGRQRDRYKDAQEHLSNFDRSLSKGRFDRGALRHALDNIESVLNHNTLQANSRDALMRDITNLKIARDRQN